MFENKIIVLINGKNATKGNDHSGIHLCHDSHLVVIYGTFDIRNHF